jgi:predicted Zn-dependent peptidase
MPGVAPSRSASGSGRSRDERPAISGHCHFLEHLLFKGTTTRTALDIAEAFDAVGGDVNAFTAKEYTCYYARVLDRDLEMAVEPLADMLEHSTIQPVDLEAESAILSEIDMHETRPRTSCTTCSPRRCGPATRSAGRSSARVPGSRATRASVRGFYRRHYVPGRLVVAAAGNVARLARTVAVGPMDVGRSGRLAGRLRGASGTLAGHRARRAGT